jgi:predicted hydrocarbon binding protein/KaiC/GvpD/RAD55 family RecA-like ATPase
MAFITAFLNEGIRSRNFCGLASYDMPHWELIDRLTELGVNAKDALDTGSLVILDLWNEGEYDHERKGPILMTSNVNDPNSVLRVYSDLVEINRTRLGSGRFTGSRVAVCSLSSQIMNYRFEPTYKLVKVALMMSKQQKAASVTVLSPRMFDGTVVAAFEHLFDGILVLTMKSVKGRFQRFIRVKRSPISSFHTDEVPYEVLNNKPRLVTYFSEPFTTFRNQLTFNVDGTMSLMGSRVVVANIDAVQSVMEHFVGEMGYEKATERVYRIFKEHGQAIFRRFLSSAHIVIGEVDSNKLLELFSAYMSATGLGMIEVVSFSNNVISLRITNSVCVGSNDLGKPANPFLSGMFAGVIESLLGRKVKCTETRCMAQGDEYCEFTCQVAG